MLLAEYLQTARHVLPWQMVLCLLHSNYCSEECVHLQGTSPDISFDSDSIPMPGLVFRSRYALRRFLLSTTKRHQGSAVTLLFFLFIREIFNLVFNFKEKINVFFSFGALFTSETLSYPAKASVIRKPL